MSSSVNKSMEEGIKLLKVFKQESNNHNYYEIRIFNLETGEFTHYFQDKNIGFTFSEYKSNVLKMGYKSVMECLKELKKRGYLGETIDYKVQQDSERNGLINLGVDRIKRNKRINTKDFEDIILKLSKYGLGFCDAQNKIIGNFQHSIKEVI